MDEKKKKFIIEIFRKKEPEELTAALADPAGKLDLGSAAALCAADGCAMGLRAARIAEERLGSGERLDYVLRNLDKLRSYFVYLIDEDVKGRNIMKRAVKEGDPQKIEAAREPAAAISDEVICQSINVMELLDELASFAPAESAIYIGSAAELLMGAIESARLYVLCLASGSADETYAFVVRRENELRLEGLREPLERIRAFARRDLR